MTQQTMDELIARLHKKYSAMGDWLQTSMPPKPAGKGPIMEKVWLDPNSTIEPPKPIEVSRLAKENGELRESLRIMQGEMNRVLAEKCVLFDRLTMVEGAVIRSMRKAARAE